MKMWTSTIAFVCAVLICAPIFPAGGPPKAAFKQLQSLAGDWEGKDEQGGAAKTNFKIVAAGTAVMETISPTGMGMEDMLTLYSVDDESIVLVHYCPTNNQPRMKATPGAGEVKELTFAFHGAGNLPTEATGHQHKLVIRFEDADNITETWTWRAKGKDTPMVFHFARKKS
ncbi:MAG: hypothetical protein WB987_13475 [Candidatus Acidiferrales bacterium]